MAINVVDLLNQQSGYDPGHRAATLSPRSTSSIEYAKIYFPPPRFFKSSLKLLLFIALLSLRRFNLDTDVLAVDDAYDVGCPRRPKSNIVPLALAFHWKSAAVVAIVKYVLPCEPFEDGLLRCAFLHLLS